MYKLFTELNDEIKFTLHSDDYNYSANNNLSDLLYKFTELENLIMKKFDNN